MQTLYLAIDANFRLKQTQKKVSNEIVDPCLNGGCAYFVGEAAYKTHLSLLDRDNPTEESYKFCNTCDVIKLANIKGSAALDANSVTTVDCSRHDIKHACSAGNLQHVERYVILHYPFVHSVAFDGRPHLLPPGKSTSTFS